MVGKQPRPENSSDMTPSGLPIDRSEPIYQEAIQIGSIKLSDLEITSDSTLHLAGHSITRSQIRPMVFTT